MKLNKFLSKFKSKFDDNKLGLKIVPLDGDHYKFDIYLNDELVVSGFKISHGSSGEIHGENPMAHQLGINVTKLREIESCPFDGKRFISESRCVNN